MANVYIETRPKGRHEEGPIEDYVVEDHSNHVLATFKTQREAIDWAIKMVTRPGSSGSTSHLIRPCRLDGRQAELFHQSFHVNINPRSQLRDRTARV